MTDLTQNKYVIGAVALAVLATMAGPLYTIIKNATVDSSSFLAIPLLGTLASSNVIGILFGVTILGGMFAYLKFKKNGR